MFQGNTLFLGDSMMVGTSGLVPVDGGRLEVAKVGAPSTWALDAVMKEGLSGFRNLVVLTGVNDIGGRSAEAIANTVASIWRHGLASGVRVYGATLPPFKGWPSFRPFAEFERKRRDLNTLLARKASELGVALIPLSELLADPSDPERLAPSVDSGDHLHPKKGALALALTRGGSEVSSPGSPSDPPDGFPVIPLAGAAILSALVLWRLMR